MMMMMMMMMMIEGIQCILASAGTNAICQTISNNVNIFYTRSSSSLERELLGERTMPSAGDGFTSSPTGLCSVWIC